LAAENTPAAAASPKEDQGATDTPQDDGQETRRPGSGDAKQLAVEQQRMAVRLAELKNEKLRRQVAQMEAEVGPDEPQNAPQTKASDEAQSSRMAQPVAAAQPRPRHWLALGSFLLLVVLPLVLSAWYLWTRAHDRYVSYAGFSVRTEEIGSALELLGGVAEFSGSSSSDTDILYKFIQSPELVRRVNAQVDLREIWGRPGRSWWNPAHDPVFAYNPAGVLPSLFGTEARPPEGSIEDLTDHWGRMVKVYSDSGTGLIDLEVQAFTAEEARTIAQIIYDESSDMINRLSAIARDDATAYAREELDQAVERLKRARQAMTQFRNETQIVDPSASIQGQMGILSSLQSELAQTFIDLDILRQTARENDPRITQLERRVRVIEDRIEAERRKLGMGQGDGRIQDADAFANLVGEFESLAVDLKFAEESYTASLSAYDSAVAEAQRKSRYLAAHVNPTLPESAKRPDRLTLLGLVALFTFLTWAILMLAIYALQDRR
jgi:capsular polysaccharide transport system permease protein